MSFTKNITSQAGEDGDLHELFRRIGVQNKWCCEFGASSWTILYDERSTRRSFFNFQLFGGTPIHAQEIFLESSEEEIALRSIFRRGWEEDTSKPITPIKLETFEEKRDKK